MNSIQRPIKKAYERLRPAWTRCIDIGLLIIIAIIIVLHLKASLVIGIICAITLGMTYVILRRKRGSYKSRRQTPNTDPAYSRRVRSFIEELSDGEMLIWESRQHFVAVLKWWVRGVLLLVLTIAIGANFSANLIWIVLGSLTVASLVMCVYEVISWYLYRFCMTNQRIFVISGIIERDYDEMRIDTITDRKIREPIASRVLAWLRIIETEYGYGRLESPGQEQDITHIGPLPFVKRVSTLIDTHRTPPEREDIALLKEIRDILGAQHTTGEITELLRQLRDMAKQSRLKNQSE